jgi:hypothetical protein
VTFIRSFQSYMVPGRLTLHDFRAVNWKSAGMRSTVRSSWRSASAGKAPQEETT